MTGEREAAAAQRRVVLVTGLSGAGRTTALKALEDLGFEAVDNLPLSLLQSLVLGATNETRQPAGTAARPLAIGIDIRTRDFAIPVVIGELDRLGLDPHIAVRTLFLDCDEEELRRRYAETRHRHPLAADRPVADGIAQERRLLEPLRERADAVLDTTAWGPGQLKQAIAARFAPAASPGLAVFVISFAYRRGLPREADLVFDVRFMPSPHYDPALAPLTGLDEPVQRFIRETEDFNRFFAGLTGWLKPLLPRFAAEGKSYLTLAVGCTGGRHRSVFVAERLAAWLAGLGEQVAVQHRELGDVAARPQPRAAIDAVQP